MDPDRAPHFSEEVASPANRRCETGERELPEGAYGKLIIEEAAICLPPVVAAQAIRISVRIVWSRGSPDHVNPAAPEGGGAALPIRSRDQLFAQET